MFPSKSIACSRTSMEVRRHKSHISFQFYCTPTYFQYPKLYNMTEKVLLYSLGYWKYVIAHHAFPFNSIVTSRISNIPSCRTGLSKSCYTIWGIGSRSLQITYFPEILLHARLLPISHALSQDLESLLCARAYYKQSLTGI